MNARLIPRSRLIWGINTNKRSSARALLHLSSTRQPATTLSSTSTSRFATLTIIARFLDIEPSIELSALLALLTSHSNRVLTFFAQLGVFARLASKTCLHYGGTGFHTTNYRSRSYYAPRIFFSRK